MRRSVMDHEAAGCKLSAREVWDALREGRMEYPASMWAEYPIRFRVVSLPKLRACRRRQALTQKDVAERLGVSESMVIKIETGERRTTADEVVALATAIGVDVDLVLEP